jgi:hypothetical protein
MQKVPILFKKVPILLVKVRLLFFPLRALNKIKLILNKATKKPQIKWLIIVRRRVNAVRLELNLVVAKLRCGAVRCGAVRCGAVRCGAVRCGAVRCKYMCIHKC